MSLISTSQCIVICYVLLYDPRSHFFDVDWANGSSKHDRRVMVPILGDPIGAILDKGELKLEYVECGQDSAAFVIKYWSNTLPVEPSCYADIIQHLTSQGVKISALDAVHSVATSLFPHGGRDGKAPSVEDRTGRAEKVHNMKKALRQAISGDAVAKVREALEKINSSGQGKSSRDRFVDQLVNRQAYRLCFWRVASEELNYRRFFDITSLAGLRMEDKDVFEHAHKLIFKVWPIICVILPSCLMFLQGYEQWHPPTHGLAPRSP